MRRPRLPSPSWRRVLSLRGSEDLQDRFHVSKKEGATLPGGGPGGVPQGAPGSGWGCGDLSPAVPFLRGLFGLHVRGLVHSNPVRSQVEHEGGIHLPAVLQKGRPLQDIVYRNDVEIDYHGSGRGGEGHEKSVQVGLVAVGRDEEELPDAMIFPAGQELVQGPVKGFPAQAGGAGEPFPSGQGDTVMKAGCHQDPGTAGYLPGHGSGDEGVCAQRKVGTVLDQGPHGKQEPGIPGQNPPHFRPGKAIQGP